LDAENMTVVINHDVMSLAFLDEMSTTEAMEKEVVLNEFFGKYGTHRCYLTTQYGGSDPEKLYVGPLRT